jgi:hypothetical protein
MNKSLAIALSVMFIFSCSDNPAGISSKASKSPDEVALEYIKHEAAFNNKGMKQLLTNEDKDSFRPLDLGAASEFMDPKTIIEARKMFAPYIKYEILSSEVMETRAQIKINTVAPNLLSAVTQILATSMQSVFAEPEDDESSKDDASLLEDKIGELAKSGDLPTVEIETVINLVFEENEWRVFQNFKLKGILADAQKFESEKDYAKAMTKVSTALEIDPMNDEANNMAVSIQEKINIEKIKSEYFSKVEIFEFEARIFNKSSYSDGTPGVTFALKNNGDKTLSGVTVKVYFLDFDGRPIAEKSYSPVRSSIFCYSDCDPLKPNYVWRQGDNFYSIDTLGPEWSGEATIEIEDIEFEF